MDLDAYPYRGPSPSVDTEIPHFWNPEVKVSWHEVGIAEGSCYSDTRKWVPPPQPRWEPQCELTRQSEASATPGGVTGG